jgi:hypothetical protein
MTGKIVFEDWSFFNAAVDRRAAQLGAPADAAPTPFPKAVPTRAPAPPGAAPLPVRAGQPSFWWPPLLVAGILLLILLLALLGNTSWWHSTWPRPALPPLPAAARPDLPPQPQPQPQPPAGAKDAAVSNYVLFHSVAFRGGEVVTGWNFLRNGDPAPNEQYCYFIRPRALDGSVLPDGSRVTRPLLGAPLATPGRRRDDNEQIRYDIARVPGSGTLPLPDSLAADLGQAGWTEAASKCAWHGG